MSLLNTFAFPLLQLWDNREIISIQKQTGEKPLFLPSDIYLDAKERMEYQDYCKKNAQAKVTV